MSRPGIWVLMAVAMGAYVVAYVLASPALGSQTSILAVLPVVLGGWLLGSRGGLLVGLLAIALNTVLVSVIRDAPLQEWARAGGLLGSAALLLVGGVTGWLRDLKAEAARAVIRQEEAQVQIIQQERLRALGEMAAGIAHDVNNNLTGVLGFSEMLLNHRENLDNKEAVTHALRAINTSAKDAAEVVRRLAESYRPLKDSETFALIDLGRLVEQVVTFTQPKWQQQAQSRGVDVRVETDLSEVPLVAGNESELREVLTNLIFNAVDAMQISGGITVRAQPEGEDVVLSVEDTGTGMTEEVRRRSMEPFFSTKGVAGSGLGLSLAYGVIQRHRGTIEIESEIGSGTTVVVRLPVQAGQQRAAVGGEVIAKTAALRVLAVDDQPMPLEVVARYLAADGHFVETATNGQEALKKFQASEFDVVITDRAMPIINGDQLTALIKETAPEVPVILLTGFGDMILANEESVGDVAVVVAKPVTVAALRDALAKAIA